MNAKPETVNPLEENIGSKLLDIGLGDDFSNLTSKVKATKAKLSKWDYQTKKLLDIKENHQQDKKRAY